MPLLNRRSHTGSITPALTSYNFTSAARGYSSVATDLSGQNYSATPKSRCHYALQNIADAIGVHMLW